MPRLIVTTDRSPIPRESSVLLDEHVNTVHLSSDHAASQLVERIAWAIGDAEQAEAAAPAAPAAQEPAGRAVQRDGSRRRARARGALAAAV